MEVTPDSTQERKVIWIYTTVNEIPDIIFEHEEIPKVDSNQPQYMRRYSSHSLTEVFRAMGCQQPLSAAISDWMFNFLKHCPTNQLSYILGNGSNNLFSNQRTYSKSGQFVVLTRMQFHRLACASLHVHQFRKIRYSVDFRLTLDFMEDRRFFIILLSGAPGTGKSTMASLIASRMSVNHILSTDSIRHAMRTFYPKEKYPILYKSTYECGDVVDPDHKMSETERCIKGYQEQSDLVGMQLTSVIKSFVDLRSSLIVEGVHLSISVMLNLVQQFPNVVPFLVYIKKEDFHKQRFAVRAKFMTTDPSQNRYISHFDSIRCVQSFLSEGASQHLLPKIDNRNIDRSLETMHQTIFSYLKKLKGRKSMYDESTQKLSFLYSVWKRRKQKITSKSKSLKAIKSMKKAPIEEIYQKQSQVSIQVCETSKNANEEMPNINDEQSNKQINFNFENTSIEDQQQSMINSKEIEYQTLYDELQAALPVEGKKISSDYMDGNVIQYLKNGSMLMLYNGEEETEEKMIQIKGKAFKTDFQKNGKNESNTKADVSPVSSSQSSSANLMLHHKHNNSPSILSSGHLIETSQSIPNSMNQMNGASNLTSDKHDAQFSTNTTAIVTENQEKIHIENDPKLYIEMNQSKSADNLSNNNQNIEYQNHSINTSLSQNLNVNSNSSPPSSSSFNNNKSGEQNPPNLSPPNQSEVSSTTSMVMHIESQQSVNRKTSDLVSMPIENESNQTQSKTLNSEEKVIIMSTNEVNKYNDKSSVNINDNLKTVINDSNENENDNDNDNDNFSEFPDTETDMDPAEVTLTDFVETTDSEAVDWKSFLSACGSNYKNFNFNFNIFHQQQQNQLQQSQQQQNQQQQNPSQQNLSQQNLSQQNLSQQNLSQQNISQQNLSQQNLSQQNQSQQNQSQQSQSQQNQSQQNHQQQNHHQQQNYQQQNHQQQNLQ